MSNRRNVTVFGAFIGTCDRRAAMETTPAAVYYEFSPDWGVDLPRGEMTVDLETGSAEFHDAKGACISRHDLFPIVQAKRNTANAR